MPLGPELRRDRWTGAGLAVLGLAYLYANRRYALDSLATPGPGVFPLAAGLAVLVLAGYQAIATGWGPARRTAGEASPIGGGRPPERVAALLMSGLLLLYAASIGTLGFLAASFALVVLASRLMGVPRWWRPALIAAGVTGGVYVIFSVWLGVPLPAGLFR